jgi:hypothetical protein
MILEDAKTSCSCTSRTCVALHQGLTQTYPESDTIMAIQDPVTTTPVTAEEMLGAAQRLKFAVPPTHERDYMELLKKTDACCELIMAEDGESKPRRRVLLGRLGLASSRQRLIWSKRKDRGEGNRGGARYDGSGGSASSSGPRVEGRAHHSPDYKPVPDYKTFPRGNVHLPEADENPLRAWAWRADIGEPVSATGKLLSGKTVVFKDTICVAGVPLLFGTNAFEGYVRECAAGAGGRLADRT